MRNWAALLTGAAVFITVGGLTPDAEAQSVFQKLFGFGNPAVSVPVAPQPYRQIVPSHRSQNRAPVHAPLPPPPAAEDDIGPPDSGGPYKTLCVRACDGFYFPLRHNARHENFASDAKSCKNACGTEARLFYYPVTAPDGPDEMVDLAGRKYSEIPHAFAYRKTAVQGCTCKPVPWSSAEQARHQTYADQEAIELAKDDAFVKARTAAEAKTEAKTEAAAEPAAIAAVAASDAMPDAGTATPVPEKIQRPVRRRARSFVQRAGYSCLPPKPAVKWPLSSLFGGSASKPLWSKTPQ